MSAPSQVDLITGGAGIVGTHLAEALCHAGRTVRVLDLKRWPCYPPGVVQIIGDVRDSTTLREASLGVDCVYHLSTLINHDRVSPAVFRSVIVDGGENVVRVAERAGARRIVIFTTTEVYGHLSPGPRAEEGHYRPLDEYGRAKVALEEACFRMAERGSQLCIIRPPVIVGPRFQFSPLPRLFELFRHNWPVPVAGDGGFRIQCVHVDDAVSIAMTAAHRADAVGEAFNVGSSETPSYRELMVALRRHIGSSSPLVHLPLRSTLRMMRLANRFTSPLFLEPGQFEIMGEDYLLDLSKAERLLGWKPTRTNFEAFRDAYDWYLCTRPYPKPRKLRAR